MKPPNLHAIDTIATLTKGLYTDVFSSQLYPDFNSCVLLLPVQEQWFVHVTDVTHVLRRDGDSDV